MSLEQEAGVSLVTVTACGLDSDESGVLQGRSRRGEDDSGTGEFLEPRGVTDGVSELQGVTDGGEDGPSTAAVSVSVPQSAGYLQSGQTVTALMQHTARLFGVRVASRRWWRWQVRRRVHLEGSTG